MKKGDIVLHKYLHVTYTYEQPFDTDRSIVTDKTGNQITVYNEYLSVDHERMFIKHIKTKIQELWRKTQSTALLKK
jgi:hypothetical protein